MNQLVDGDGDSFDGQDADFFGGGGGGDGGDASGGGGGGNDDGEAGGNGSGGAGEVSEGVSKTEAVKQLLGIPNLGVGGGGGGGGGAGASGGGGSDNVVNDALAAYTAALSLGSSQATPSVNVGPPTDGASRPREGN